MSRYLGPLNKKARALGFSLRRNKQEFSRGKKRTNPPGIHGGKRKRKLSTYGTELREKQKVEYGYGWRDYQLKNEYVKARARAGDSGTNLLISSESRLDNLVFRSGLVNTLPFARQWVNHGHFLVNGKEVKTPSRQIEVGQNISLRKVKMAENKLIKNSLEQNIKPPLYLSLDRQKLVITYIRHPQPKELDQAINTSTVVKWFSRKV